MNKIIFLLILLLALFVRIYQITTVPPHLYWDEASISYNAYSINETGKDEWGETMPFLFRSFDDYKLPMYIYLTSVSQKVFGLTDFAVRLPSGLAGVGSVALIYFIVLELGILIWKKKNYALASISMLLLAISPWHLQFTRGGFEASVALAFTLLGIYMVLYGIRKKSNVIYFGMISFALSLYTYHASAIIVPLTLGLFAFVFRVDMLKRWKTTVLCLLIFGIAVIPYFHNYVMSKNGQTRGRTESFINMSGAPLANFTSNFVSSFSTDFLFFKGDQNGRHSIKKIGELYAWQLPFVLAGIYFLLKKRSKATVIILGLLFIGSLPPALTLVSPHALRGLTAVVPWMILTGVGMVYIFTKIKQFKYLIIPIVLYFLFQYLHLYYVYFPVAFEPDWQGGRRELMEYINKIEQSYDRIFLHTDVEPIYVLLYSSVDPRTVQANKHNLKKIGKIEYHHLGSSPVKLDPKEKNLIIAPNWMSPNQSLELKREMFTTHGEPVYRIYEY